MQNAHGVETTSKSASHAKSSVSVPMEVSPHEDENELAEETDPTSDPTELSSRKGQCKRKSAL